MSALPSPAGVAAVTPKPVRRWYAHYVLVVLLFSYAVNFMDRNILNTLIDPIKAELHVSDTLMGLLVGFGFAVFNSIAGIPIARWADRGNRRSIIAIGMTLWCAMTGLSGMARSFSHLAAARVGVGVGEAAGVPPAHSLISDYFGLETRAWAMAVFQSGLYVGIFFGYFIGGWVGEYYGWRAAFWVAGLPGLAIALLVRFTVEEPPRGAADDAAPDAVQPLGEVLRFLARQRAFVLIALGIALISLSNYALSVWTPSFLRRIHHASGAEIGTLVAVIKGGAGFAGTLIGGAIVARRSAADARSWMRTSALATVLVAPLLVVFLFAESKSLAYVAFGMSIVLVGFHYGPAYALTQTLVRQRMRSVASSVVYLGISLIGLGCGPLLVGVLNDALGARYGVAAVRYSLLLSVAAAVLGAGCFAWSNQFLPEDLARLNALPAPRFNRTS
jgi:predicted MFS family arabinose efflux permease